jgi:hypothetical protein
MARKRGRFYQSGKRCIIVPDGEEEGFPGRVNEPGDPLFPGETLMSLHHGENNAVEYEPIFEMERTDVARGGPAMVASDAYRNGWDRVFKGQLN